MDTVPTELTRRYLIEHAECTLFSGYHQWQAWMWRQIVLLDVAGKWEPDDYPHYMSEFWDIFCERRNTWKPVYFVIDTNHLRIQDEGFRDYMKNTWAHLLDRDDLAICLVESKGMKRAIWTAIHHLLGKEGRVRMFGSHEQALEWVRKQASAPAPCAPPENGGCR